MAFDEHDEGPFWISNTEHQLKRCAVSKSGTWKRKFTKNKLISCLQEKWVVTKGKLADLISAAQKMEYLLRRRYRKIKKDGWDKQRGYYKLHLNGV